MAHAHAKKVINVCRCLWMSVIHIHAIDGGVHNIQSLVLSLTATL